MALQLPLRQRGVSTAQDAAIEKYPGINPDQALNKFVKENQTEDIFFLNDEGHRFIWGPDIDYYHKTNSDFDTFYEIHRGCREKYWFRRVKRTLAVVDEPKSEELSALVAHPSKQGWNLPIEHVRHFLKIPLGNALGPDLVACNWKRFYSEPCMTVVGDNNEYYATGTPTHIDVRYHFLRERVMEVKDIFTERVAGTENVADVLTKPLALKKPKYSTGKTGVDPSGQHCLYFSSEAPTLCGISSLLMVNEALCLRTYGYEPGTKEPMHRASGFIFQMVNKHYHESSPSFFRGVGECRPNPRKPSAANWNCAIAWAIPKTEKKHRLLRLLGWVFYDYFLRFLWTIRPSKAAILRSLDFGGIPLRDSRVPRPPHPLRPGEPTNRDEALLPLLETDLRNILSLEKLHVVDENRQTLDVAKPTIVWIKGRGIERARVEAEEKQRLRMQELVMMKEVQCNFCAGNHIWAECLNLCSFCGIYGHFCRTCPKLHSHSNSIFATTSRRNVRKNRATRA
ncbi:uncharacterized protein PAC_13949 [Phialocephala subalpina]|uniref:CCHC-type domain-containing protein n=1 Tax=Phialocephala subalpina TaxID=576137 RepID=A0A1L7XGA4_9HELO|nr:uncharacterized protein PAC_13949 [Phialocephala subalpina]